MTEQTEFVRLRRSNLKTIQRELYKLKKQYKELFEDWLKKKGEYVTEVRVSWFKFYTVALQYKELNFKMLEIERQVGKE